MGVFLRDVLTNIPSAVKTFLLIHALLQICRDEEKDSQ